MKFTKGATIKAVDGDKIGNLDDIIVDPTNDNVTHIVVKKGFFFTEDRIIPVEALRVGDENTILLNASSEDFDSFPHFEENSYVRPNRDYQPEIVGESDWGHWERPTRPLFYYGLPHTGLYPGELAGRGVPQARLTKQNIPEDAVIINEGTEVYSLDDEHVGNVEGAITDDRGNTSHILISKGLIFSTERLIPMHWVRRTSDQKIQLLVDTAIVEDLPEYSEQN